MTDGEVYLACRDDVTRFAIALVGPSEANDVVSIVVTRFLASGRSLASLDNPRAYLMRAVLNESKSLWKARRRQVVPLASEAPSGHEHSELPAMDGVTPALLGLPVQQRAVTFLTYWVGLTSAEVADLLGTRPGTVRRYLHLAREHLREVLDDDG